MSQTVLVTGGAGFIGSGFIHYLTTAHPDWSILNLDKLTYAGNLENLREIEDRPNYRFIQGDICDRETVEPLVAEADYLVNFAAETHVDRSIHNAGDFIITDVFGTYVLLEAFRAADRPKRFIQISTDEVYGAIETGSARETDILAPRNPYSASKVGADRLAYTYFVTYGVPVIVTRASNNYGPRQYPEKLIPLFVTNALEDRPLPLYGDGLQVRDWLHVDDHCRAIDLVLEHGIDGVGLPPRPADADSMSIVAENGGELYSLMVDSVGEVLALSQSAYERNLPTLDPKFRAFSDGIYRLDDQLLVVLDVNRMLDYEHTEAA